MTIIINFSKNYINPKTLIKEFSKKKIKIIQIRPKHQFHDSLSIIKKLKNFKVINFLIYGDDEINKEVLDVLKKKKCKHIIKWGQGLDSIDLKYAKKVKIKVKNFPGIFKDEVAELAIGFLILLKRKILKIHKMVKGGRWNKNMSQSLVNSTVGIIGLGRIGKAITNRLKNFNVKIIYNDIKKINSGFKKTSLKKLFEISDVIFIACDLNNSNIEFLNKRIFKFAKKKPILINIARGKLINESDLVKYLKMKKISCYGTDVFKIEPVSINNPLLKFKDDRVVFTNHSASTTHEAVLRVNSLISKFIISQV